MTLENFDIDKSGMPQSGITPAREVLEDLRKATEVVSRALNVSFNRGAVRLRSIFRARDNIQEGINKLRRQE